MSDEKATSGDMEKEGCYRSEQVNIRCFLLKLIACHMLDGETEHIEILSSLKAGDPRVSIHLAQEYYDLCKV